MKCICCLNKMDRSIERYYPLWFCAECDYATQDFRVPFHYSRQYQEKYKKMPEHELSYLRLSLILPLVSKDSRILDYGCGNGAFLDILRFVGLDATGFNAHDQIPAGRFDVVTMFDVLEHLDDPREIFTIAPEYFIVSVPDFKAVTSGSVEMRQWRHYKPDEHIHYFSFMALRRYFRLNGYECVDESHIEDFIRRAPHPNILTCIFRRQDKV